MALSVTTDQLPEGFQIIDYGTLRHRGRFASGCVQVIDGAGVSYWFKTAKQAMRFILKGGVR